MPPPEIMKLIAVFAAWNAFVFAAYFVDKQAARHDQRRISEKTLLTLALLAGTPGAITAQRLLRHKTRKEPFRSLLMAIAMLHLLIVLAIISGVAGRMLGLF
jgi:uncharacterized membrane protein YsdA (DUF1294 family)